MKRTISILLVLCMVFAGGAALMDKAEASSSETTLRLSFSEVERQVRNGNPAIRNNGITLQNIDEMLGSDDMLSSLRSSQNQLIALQNQTRRVLDQVQASQTSLYPTPLELGVMFALEVDIANLGVSIAQLTAQMEQVYNAPRASRDKTAQQLNNANRQIVWGAESLFMGYHTLSRQLEQTKENLRTLDRNIDILERRLSLGQITARVLQSVKNSRAGLELGIKSMESELGNLMAQMNLLLGRKHDAPLDLGLIPAADRAFLKSIDKERDLRTARRNNHVLNISRIDIDEQSGKQGETARGQEAIANNNYDSEMRAIDQRFESLTKAISDRIALLESAENQLAYLQQGLEETQKRFERGMVSRLVLEQAESEVFLQTLSVSSADAELFNAIRRYQWLVLGLSV